MDKAFWLERWERNQIGFHEGEVNSHLQAFWSRMRLPAGSRIFVPLCGKSRDLLWLRAQGHEVFGVEWSPVAVRDFFSENGLVPDTIDEEGYEEWRADGVVLRCGDFFDLKPGDLEGVAGVYDRASLIALPPDSRPAYAEHLVALLPLAAPLLLITLEYDQGEMSGPPFSVTEAEVRLLFGRVRAVDLIYERDVLGEHGRFRERGLNRLHEKVYLLEAPR